VAKAIDRVGELGDDGGIEMDIGIAEEVDGRRDLARELLEHQVLVLGLGAELGRLEQALAIPLGVLDAIGQIRPRQHPVQGERFVTLVEFGTDQALHLIDQPVVLVVEDGVDGCERDVLVGAAVTGNIVRVEQLVVVDGLIAGWSWDNDIARGRVGIRRERAAVLGERHGVKGGVVDEGMTREDHRGQGICRIRMCQVETGGGAFNQTDGTVRVLHHHLGKAM
jgi:hypothetical protein